MTVLDSIDRVRGGRQRSKIDRSNGELHNPVTGERIAFRERGEVVRFDYYLEPGGFAVGKVDHLHPALEERIDVRSGRLGVRLDGDEWTATPGTRFAILPGTPHTVWNDGADEVHAVIEFSPGLEVAAFFETMFGLAREGRTTRWGLPGPLQGSTLLAEFRDEFAVAGVPISVQRAFARAVAPIGRRMGYRAQYPRYRSTEVE